eukprot:616158-Rhodomonas_salina.4
MGDLNGPGPVRELPQLAVTLEWCITVQLGRCIARQSGSLGSTPPLGLCVPLARLEARLALLPSIHNGHLTV